MTPLHNAAQTGQPGAVKALVDAKAMVNIRLVSRERESLPPIHSLNLHFRHPPFPVLALAGAWPVPNNESKGEA